MNMPRQTSPAMARFTSRSTRAGESWCGAICCRLVRQMAMSSEAGMPLPDTSATARPSRAGEST